MSTPPLTTFDSLVQQESDLIGSAEERLGWPVAMARDATLLLSTFMASVDAAHHMYIRCMAIMKTHHTLAFMSTLRLHHVQAMMNLRQAAEAASNAAFALAHPDAVYVDGDKGFIMNPKEVGSRSYKWIRQKFPLHSTNLKVLKDIINDQSAHFNIVNSARLVDDLPEGDIWHTGFFDREDKYLQHNDLWLLTNLSLCAMHLMTEVGKVHGGFKLDAEAEGRAKNIQFHANRLRSEMTSSERHQRATALAEAAKAARGGS
jgi:hypothetical protein